MGEVYEAVHERLAHRYAVKILHPGVRDHPEALPRFMREAQVTSRLRHPGIVSVIDFNTLPGGLAYLVMEYLEGEALGKILAASGPLPLARVVDITNQVSSALTAAHAQGVIHRDMHPQNIFVVPAGGGEGERIKILDFGISKIAAASQRITGMATVMGTPQYMSPEQAEGKTDQLDAASDQFSLAAIVYEMLTGRSAFSGETLASIAYQVVHGTPIPIQTLRPELPAEVENVVSRGLAKNKGERFPSVSEFAVHLRWTATLPPSEGARRPGGAHDELTVVATSPEETTPVSTLPSGMAAVLRETSTGLSLRTGFSSPAVSPPALEPADDEGLLVDKLRRRRLLVLGAVVAGGTLALVAAVNLAPRAPGPRAPDSPGAAAVTPAPPPSPASKPPPTETGRLVPPSTPPAPAPAPAAAPASGPASALAPVTAAPVEKKAPPRGRPHAPNKAPAATEKTPPPPGDRPAGQCRITVGSYPWSELWVDGADTAQIGRASCRERV